MWVYEAGVFRPERRRIVYLVTSRLRGRYKPEHLRTFLSYAEAELAYTGFDLAKPPGEHARLVNVAQRDARPVHRRPVADDPEYLSIAQLPVVYDAAAMCPRSIAGSPRSFRR